MPKLTFRFPKHRGHSICDFAWVELVRRDTDLPVKYGLAEPLG